jgi:hypothetical protein
MTNPSGAGANEGSAGRLASAIADRCRSIIDNERFQFFIVGVIVVNSI